MNVLELCAGYGGIGLGVRIAIPSARLVCAVERQAYCASLLMERLGAASMGGPALWPDVESFAWALAGRNRERLRLPDPAGWADIVCAGFPCPPFSCAGKRQGISDERWIWPSIRRAIALLKPRYVWLENTPGLERNAPGASRKRSLDIEPDESVFSNGLRIILRDLAALGFDAEWDCIPAADIGADHFRFRIWILAHANQERQQFGTVQFGQAAGRRESESPNGRALCAQPRKRGEGWVEETHSDAADTSDLRGAAIERGAAHGDAAGGGADAADASERRQPVRGRAPGSDGQPAGGGADAADTMCGRQRRGDGRSLREVGECWAAEDDASDSPSPGLQERDGPRSLGESAHPAVAAPERRDAEPETGRMDDGSSIELGESWYADCPYAPEEWLTRGESERAEQLHALGNGVVPEQCAYALVSLATRAGWGEWNDERGLILFDFSGRDGSDESPLRLKAGSEGGSNPEKQQTVTG